MITKHDILCSLCNVETDVMRLTEEIYDLEKRVTKLEKGKKKNAKVSKQSKTVANH